MEEIRFDIKTDSGSACGYLDRMDKTFPPKWFFVMEKTRKGHFFRGQLLLINGEWKLPGSTLEEHAEYFGNLIELWYQ